MNIPILSALIASRVPEFARDSATNNALVIQHLIEEEISRSVHEQARQLCNQLKSMSPSELSELSADVGYMLKKGNAKPEGEPLSGFLGIHWECSTCGWKGFDLMVDESREYHKRWNSKQGMFCPGPISRTK